MVGIGLDHFRSDSFCILDNNLVYIYFIDFDRKGYYEVSYGA